MSYIPVREQDAFDQVLEDMLEPWLKAYDDAVEDLERRFGKASRAMPDGPGLAVLRDPSPSVSALRAPSLSQGE